MCPVMFKKELKPFLGSLEDTSESSVSETSSPDRHEAAAVLVNHCSDCIIMETYWSFFSLENRSRNKSYCHRKEKSFLGHEIPQVHS